MLRILLPRALRSLTDIRKCPLTQQTFRNHSNKFYAESYEEKSIKNADELKKKEEAEYMESVLFPAHLPRITAPLHYNTDHAKWEAHKKRKDVLKKEKRHHRGNSKVVVISGKDDKLRHFLGQTYGLRFQVRLCTKGWRMPTTSGKYFTIHAIEPSPSLPMEKGFNNQFKLHPHLKKALSNIGVTSPTPIQGQVLEKSLMHRSFVLAAETGSGKTLAFLIPIFHDYLKKKDQKLLKEHKLPNTPTALIVTPTKELAIQIYDVASAIAKEIGMPITVIKETVGDLLENPQFSYENNGLVIGTLGVLKELTHNDIYQWNHLNHVVVDEIDTLCDPSFATALKKFVVKLPGANMDEDIAKLSDDLVGTQVVLAGATILPKTAEAIKHVFNWSKLEVISTDYFHKIPLHIEQKLTRIRASEKIEKILTLTRDIKEPTLIFCNKTSTCQWLYVHLKQNGIDCIQYSSNILPIDREQHLKRFKDGESPILIATDLASLGLDAVFLKHIINYDFPSTVRNYVHRIGRVGRVGGPEGGHVTSLIAKRNEVETARAIEKAVRYDLPIEEVEISFGEDKEEGDEEENS